MTADPVRDPFRLDGARALVTGASRGIGAAVSVELARARADLALTARTLRGLKTTEEGVLSTGQKAHLIRGDFSNPRMAAKVVDEAAAALGGLDIVVHCAGVLPELPDGTPKIAPFEESTEEDWSRVLRVNLGATVELCKASKKHLVKSDRASLVLLSSVAGRIAAPGMEAYAVTKAAQDSLARSLGVAWVREGVRVNALCPGWVHTDMTDFAATTAPLSDWLMAHVPQGEWISTEKVSHSVRYLASAASSPMTGQAVALDGGVSVPDGGLAGISKPANPFVPAGDAG